MTTDDRQLRRFFIGCFAASWILWIPGVAANAGLWSLNPVLSAVLKLIGACVPAATALVLIGRTREKGAVRETLKSCFQVGRTPLFLLASVLLFIVLHLAARWIFGLWVDGNLPSSGMVRTLVDGIVFFVLAFLVGGGLGEEIGWRGFALPLLQRRFSGITSSLILSTFWIVWHLPLFVYEGTNQSLIPFWMFILAVYPLGILLTLVYNTTGTIFASALIHTVGNLCGEVFRILPDESQPSLAGFGLLIGLYGLAAIVVLLIWGKDLVTRPRRRSEAE